MWQKYKTFMQNFFGHPIAFVIVYIIFMIPTYFLPYLGSNSAVLGATAAAAGNGINPAFWWHLIALVVLIGITATRGTVIGKKWIQIFPILAAVFDLVPGLSLIPLVPTVMHLCAIIIGVKGPNIVPAPTEQQS